MRLHLYLVTEQAIPFDYLPTLKSAFHLWTGHNDTLHDGLSLYSYAWLRGGRAGRGGIRFAEGAQWFISAPNREVVHTIISGVLRAPEIGLAARRRLQSDRVELK
ncbi:MAG: hypothetical protein ACRYF0_12985 [Janthinobacterium lividum]